jgi:hypothetical protein
MKDNRKMGIISIYVFLKLLFMYGGSICVGEYYVFSN